MKSLISSILILATLVGFAQRDYEVITSPIYKHNKPRIYAEDVLGVAEGMMYVMFSTKAVKVATADEFFVKMYDKEDLGFVKSAALMSETRMSEKKLKNLYYYDHVITNKGLLFFFRMDGKKGMVDVYLATYDLNLNLTKDLTRVMTYNEKESRFFGLSDGNYPNLAMVTLNKAKNDEDLFLEYKLIDKEFDLVKSGKIDLPYKQSSSDGSGWFGRGKGKDRRAFTDNLYMDSKGRVLTTVNIDTKNPTASGKKSKADKYKNRYYKSAVIIDLENEDLKDLPIKLDDKKNVKNFTAIFADDNIHITGFYSDRMKEKKGREMHGVFYMRMNTDEGTFERKRTVDFPDDFLARFNSQNTLISKGRRKKESKKESIHEGFEMSEVILDFESRALTAYCEPIQNGSYTYTDSRGNSYTKYYTKRGSAFFFQVNAEGEFKYYNTIRKYSYFESGSPSIWNIKTMHVYRTPKGDKDYLMYHTDKIYDDKNPKDLSGKKAKWKKVKRDFVVAEIDNEYGSFENNYPQEYAKKQKDDYGVNLNTIAEINGELYSFSTRGKMRISRLVSAVVFFPIFWVFTMNPKSYYQKIQFHNLRFIEGEGDDDDDYTFIEPPKKPGKSG